MVHIFDLNWHDVSSWYRSDIKFMFIVIRTNLGLFPLWNIVSTFHVFPVEIHRNLNIHLPRRKSRMHVNPSRIFSECKCMVLIFLLTLNLTENRMNMLDTALQHHKITLFLRNLKNNHCFFLEKKIIEIDKWQIHIYTSIVTWKSRSSTKFKWII